jgi:hypothetical protein
MDNSLPFEVVCVETGGETFYEDFMTSCEDVPQPVVGTHYNVEEVHEHGEITWYRLAELPEDCYYDADLFRRISPYQNSVSRSLAEQALKDTGDSRQDMKPERKEAEV